jgi:tRNA U38,U39,U40 pseudouridine synthase TruA
MCVKSDSNLKSFIYLFELKLKKNRGDLDIERMREAGKRLIGERDYRNFCKMDVGNGVVTFIRKIFDISINIIDDKEENNM